MNRDRAMVLVFTAIAAMIYFYFDCQKREADLQPIRKSIIASHRPLVLHFYADWCGSCRTFEPILRNTISAYGDTIGCRDLNIDQGQNGKLLHSFGRSAIPTIVIFDRKGNTVAIETGCIGAQELDNDLRKAVKY